METVEADEKELVADAASGDKAAFEELVRRNQREVYTLALRLTKDEGEADDVTQESFISAWLHLESFRGEISFRAWVLKIALNKCRSFWRWSRIRRFVNFDRSEDGDEQLGLEERLPDDRMPGPEQACECAERAAAINKALDGLSGKQREAALLRGQGLEIHEIAQIMRTAQGTIKAHLFEARRKLAAALEEVL